MYNAMQVKDVPLCPVCDEGLIGFSLNGVEIDRCMTCGGTWLDGGELEQLADLAGVTHGKLSAALAGAKGERHGKRRCVRCIGKLQVIHVNGIELDRCPHGHGLWFDRQELPNLVKSVDDDEMKAVAALFGDLFRHEQVTGG